MQALRRERGWGLSLAALACVLFASQVILAAQWSIAAKETALSGQVPFRVEVREGAEERAIQSLYGALWRQPGVLQVEYVTREQALARERGREPDYAALLDQLYPVKSPFRDMLVVNIRSAVDEEKVFVMLQSKTWADVADPSSLARMREQRSDARSMADFLQACRAGAFLSLVLLAAILLLILADIARHRATERKEELTMGRLAGARELLAYLPFAVENACLLLLALLGSVGVFILLLAFLPVLPELGALRILLPYGVGDLFMAPFLWMAAVEILCVPLFACAAARIGVQAFVRGR